MVNIGDFIELKNVFFLSGFQIDLLPLIKLLLEK
jgi:hypothetical protein